MPSLLTQHYRSRLGETFLGKLQYWEAIEALSANGGIDANAVSVLSVVPPAVMYMFVGRPQEWVDAANAEVMDSNPPIPIETVQETSFEVWRDMLGAKRAWTANMNFVVARVDWVANTVYDQYDDTVADLYADNYYVLDTTDTQYRVYKCLWNNGGAPSNTSPSLGVGVSVTPVQTADGYTWQFMYAIPSTTDKFLTTTWMPVYTDNDVIAAAETNIGSLPTAVPLIIVDPGANYNGATDILTTLVGDGAGATVSNSGAAVIGGQISSITLANSGSGYTTVTSINVYQSGATSATARAIIPPYPNHGWDPITELGAKHLMVCVRFDDTENDKLTLDNDYRRIGLLINPVDANTGEIAGEDFYRQTYDIVLAANTGVFVADDEIYNANLASAPSGIVVDVVQDANTDYVVRLTNVNVAGEATPFPAGATLVCDASGVEGTVNTAYAAELTAYTGEVLYVNHRAPVERAADQYEEVKIILPFGG